MRLEHATEFWEIDLDDRTFVVRTGRIGTRGKTQRFTAATVEAAQHAHDEEIAGALVRGFREVPGPPAPAGLKIRDAELEQALRDHRDDRDAYLVYADWLQVAGNPLGELIVAEVRRAGLVARGDKVPKLDKRIATLRGALRLPLPDRTLRLWFRHAAHRERATCTAQATWFPTATSRELFSHVMCAALDELHVGALRWSQNHVPSPSSFTRRSGEEWARDSCAS